MFHTHFSLVIPTLRPDPIVVDSTMEDPTFSSLLLVEDFGVLISVYTNEIPLVLETESLCRVKSTGTFPSRSPYL